CGYCALVPLIRNNADTTVISPLFRTFCVSFFFSSRRRHTRSVSAFLLNRSSDLRCEVLKTSAFTLAFSTSQRLRTTRASARTFRSEERRVGKECRSRWSPDHEKKKKKRDDNSFDYIGKWNSEM